MSELRIVPQGNGGGGRSDEEQTQRLLEMAGRRPEVPAEELAMIKTAARAAWQAKLRQRRGSRFSLPGTRVLALAAGLLMAVGALWWWIGSSVTGPSPVARVETIAGMVRMRASAEQRETPATALRVGQAIPAGTELETAGPDRDAPGRTCLRRAGGGSVRVDRGSRVRIASLTVLEIERGAVYVDSGVGPERDGAVEVRTPMGVAREFGTQFEVRLLDEEAAMRVRVREGMVVVEQGESSHSAVHGMELTLHDDGSVVRRRVPAHGPEWRWVLDTAPRFDLEGRTLREFLDWVARETGWQIRFADPGIEASAETIILHGAFGDLTPDQAPAVVLPGAGLRGQVKDGTLVVSAPGP